MPEAVDSLIRWPYWTFALAFLLGLGYIVSLNRYQAYQVQQSGQYVDPATGTWKKGYDWAAENRRNGFLDRMRYVLLALVTLHSALNVLYAAYCMVGDRRHGIALIFFVAMTFFMGFLWLAAGMPHASMIG
jgi:NADH:ubiquinone oxidoreductase subunit 5 (subunit L)/multisubunit Na+/H+ antiporter MnhA subunit